MPDPKEIIEISGREVAISNPGKIYFPDNGITKADVVRYYLAVADGALRGVAGRPMVLKRYVHGATGEAFFQKRAPSSRPGWPGGRTSAAST
jgi:bifunctional non-homologous end joining protein LigD